MRSGLQKLLRDAQEGAFDLVLTEALDRLSRNQADVATIYQRLLFEEVVIETLSEGQVSELHIGLKGTMNALHLKDLSLKTHRGLKGRALAGKSAGGLTYGYRAVLRMAPDGEVIRGDRVIEPQEAEVVRRIFRDYARGVSPRKIAEQLNLDGIRGPQGGTWGTSTIHGNRERGTGILNNELYIGRQVWNRLRYVKDPSSGRRVSRMNPQAEWVVTEVPELRIIEEELWEAVRVRQGALKSKDAGVPVWDRRRPRTLLSGLMQCGCCGAGFSKVSATSFGCSAARNKGRAVCGNRATIKQTDLEDMVLDALTHHLMDPTAVEAFCEAYTEERNRLCAAAASGRDALERELVSVKRDHSKLVDAIIAGVPAAQVKDRMIALDARAQEIERQLATTVGAPIVRIHPRMAETYRERVATLVKGLGETEGAEEAREAVRTLIDKIVLTPKPDGAGLSVDLHGALAALLRLATGLPSHGSTGGHQAIAPDDKSEAIETVEELVLVAGARSGHDLPFAAYLLPTCQTTVASKYR